MKKLWAMGLACALLASASGAGEQQAVLIVSRDSPIAQLDAIDIRKVFLGLPVTVAGHQVRALRNTSDARLNEIFLQQIVALSQTAYDRRVLTLAMQQGRPRPQEVPSRDRLLAQVVLDRYALSYAWSTDIAGNPRLRVLKVIWKE